MVHALFVFGTRPEAIKLAPVIKRFLSAPDDFRVTVCLTSQHREMLRQVTSFFGIREDVDLDVMMRNQSLEYVTTAVLTKLKTVLEDVKPDVLLVQGDTTTVFASALAAYYSRVTVAHVEAGLRSFDKFSPFPEEMNRALCSVLTDYHFAPTETAAGNLRREGHDGSKVFVTGNTVVDALYLGLKILGRMGGAERLALLTDAGLPEAFSEGLLEGSLRAITVTAHRRESFGAPFERMCLAMTDIIRRYPDAHIVYPVHPNPNVRETVRRFLAGFPRIHLIDPVRYEQLLLLMERSVLLLTDSGGIQEEGPSLKKPVLVMRDVTERPEGIAAGVSRLVGTDRERITTAVSELLDNEEARARMTDAGNPYGDGRASERIADILLRNIGDD